MFMNICEHFTNVHVHITSRAYGHEQFMKYHELFAKVRELGGNFFCNLPYAEQVDVLPSKNQVLCKVNHC